MLDKGIDIGKGDNPELAEELCVGTGNGSGSDEGPAPCTGRHDGTSDGMFAQGGADQIKRPGGGTGNRIDDGAALDKGLNIGKGNGPELAEEPGIAAGDSSGSDEGPANCAGLHDGPSDGMFA